MTTDIFIFSVTASFLAFDTDLHPSIHPFPLFYQTKDIEWITTENGRTLGHGWTIELAAFPFLPLCEGLLPTSS